MSNPAHAVGRWDPLRARQVVHEERVRRQDRQGHQTGGRRMGRVVQVINEHCNCQSLREPSAQVGYVW